MCECCDTAYIVYPRTGLCVNCYEARRNGFRCGHLLDEVVVYRLMTGIPVRSSRLERRAAIATLGGLGVARRTIAERVHVSMRTVERHLTKGTTRT